VPIFCSDDLAPSAHVSEPNAGSTRKKKIVLSRVVQVDLAAAKNAVTRDWEPNSPIASAGVGRPLA
jgi:hypothetical protein